VIRPPAQEGGLPERTLRRASYAPASQSGMLRFAATARRLRNIMTSLERLDGRSVKMSENLALHVAMLCVLVIIAGPAAVIARPDRVLPR
jgi:hypothetical protein